MLAVHFPGVMLPECQCLFSLALFAPRSSTLFTGAIIGVAVAVALGALAATIYTHRRDCASADMTEIDEDSAAASETKDVEDDDRASRPITPAQVAPDVDLFDASPIDRVQQNNWTAVEVVPAGDPTVRAASGCLFAASKLALIPIAVLS
jgi:hypothetical protein